MIALTTRYMYRRGVDQAEYVPDFVAARDQTNLLIETKKAADMEGAEVQAKALAALAKNYAARAG